jgi:hypothetical protein
VRSLGKASKRLALLVSRPVVHAESISLNRLYLVGLLTVSKSSFLVSITRRQQVAQIQGKPIYVVTEVAVTPLGSKAEAESSISHTQTSLQKKAVDGHETEESDSDEDSADISWAISDDVEDDDEAVASVTAALASPTGSEHKRSSSIAEDVLTRKGGYGRFASKWFSKRGWTVDQRRNLGMSIQEHDNLTSKSTSEVGQKSEPSATAIPNPNPVEDAKEQKEIEVTQNLLPKLLRTTQILFGTSKSFYFSYDYDVTRSLSNRRTTSSELPLYTEVDPLFFWNKFLLRKFIDAGQTSLVLPLMVRPIPIVKSYFV